MKAGVEISRSRLRRRVGVSVLLLTVAGLLTGPAASALAVGSSQLAATTPCSVPPMASSPQPGDGVDITATVCATDSREVETGGGTGTTGGSGTGAATGGSSIRPLTNGGALGAGSGTVAPAADSPSPTADEVDLGGVLNVGGLSNYYVPSVNPFGGDLQLWFTVRNVSNSTIEATADFWMEGIFGNRIASVDGVAIMSLKPGETRTISAELPGVGQWIILSAHARLDPPDMVDGTELSPLTRDVTAFALPWLVVLFVAAGLAGWIIVQVHRGNAVEPVGALA